ncbi:aminoglycoside phosphotransferase family protein [Streptomyces sp. WAC07149]|nr:aminoglycoside phosphotransferase family protein [Streptomyces sp. WAC07149]
MGRPDVRDRDPLPQDGLPGRPACRSLPAVAGKAASRVHGGSGRGPPAVHGPREDQVGSGRHGPLLEAAGGVLAGRTRVPRHAAREEDQRGSPGLGLTARADPRAGRGSPRSLVERPVVDALALYEEARRRDTGQSGYYNRNIRVETGEGPAVVRMRSHGAEVMDLALWREPEVLAAIADYVPSAPRLLYAGTDPEFQIHGFVPGRRVDTLGPEGTGVPGVVLNAVEGLFREMLRVPASALPRTPGDWPGEGDTPAFADRLTALVQTIRHRGDRRAEGLYEALGVPKDPCGLLRERFRGLTPRRMGLLHADLHRQNMILADSGRVAFLDWELALWGDPVYDLADHLHKMRYPADQAGEVTAGWERAAPEDCREGWRPDLGHYLAFEAVKSAVVDTVRWGRRIARAADAGERRGLAVELAAKLAAARPHWEAGARKGPEPREIEEAVQRWVA